LKFARQRGASAGSVFLLPQVEVGLTGGTSDRSTLVPFCFFIAFFIFFIFLSIFDFLCLPIFCNPSRARLARAALDRQYHALRPGRTLRKSRPPPGFAGGGAFTTSGERGAY
jgi:hypothetical protein